MISIVQLGTVDYATGLRLQEQLVALRKEEKIGDVLLLLEHSPVITLGRNAKAANVVASPEFLAQRGVELFECDRGGDVTFHGPGQIVGYPIFDLRGFPSSPKNSGTLSSRGSRSDSDGDSRACPEQPTVGRASNGDLGSAPRKHIGAVDFVRRLEEVLIRTCADFAIPTKRVAGLTGVWTDVDLKGRDFSRAGAASNPLSSRAEENDSKSRSLESRNLGVDFAVRDHDREGHDFSRAVSGKKKEAALAAEGPEAKLAAIGVHISRFVTSHGFALNVNTDLSYFNLIIPCGITAKPVTSMQQQLGRQLDLNAVAESISRNVGVVFQSQILWLNSLDVLLETCGAGAPARMP